MVSVAPDAVLCGGLQRRPLHREGDSRPVRSSYEWERTS
jgi:hypothetical protein